MSNDNDETKENSDNDSNSQNLSKNHSKCPEFYELYEYIKLNCNHIVELFRIVVIELGCDPDRNVPINDISMGLHALEELTKPDQWKEMKNYAQIKEETDKIGIGFIEWNLFYSVCKQMVEKWTMQHKLSFY